MLRAFALLILLTTAAGAFEPTLVGQVGSDRFRFPGWVQQLVVSPDGRRVLAFDTTSVWAYDTTTGRPIFRYRPDDISTLLTAAFAGDRLLTLHNPINDDFVIRHHDSAAPRPVQEIKINTTDAYEYAFSPNGRLLAVTNAKRVTLIDTHTGREVNRIPSLRRGGNATGVRFSADGRRLAVATDRNTVRIYDCPTGRQLALFKPKRGIEMFSLSPDGNRITGIVDGYGVSTLNVLTGIGKTWKVDEVADGIFDLGGGRVMTVDVAVSRFQVFDATTGKVVRRFRVPAGTETSLLNGTVVGPDGRTLYSASGEGGITAWDLTANRKLPQSAEQFAFESDIRFVGGNRLRCAPRSEGWGGVLTAPEAMWDLSTGRPLPTGPTTELGDLSPSGLWRATYHDDRVVITNTTTGKIARTQKVPADAGVHAVWFRNGDGQVCIKTTDAVLVWNLATDRTRRVPVPLHENVLPSLTTPGRWFGTWVKVPQQENEETVLRIVDLDTGRAAFDLRGIAGDQHLFTPDGSRLIRCRSNPATDWDGESQSTIEQYDTATGRLIRTVSAAGWQLRAVSPDGRTLLISDSLGDGEGQLSTLVAVELATGRERWRVPTSKDWFLHGAAFAPDGRRIAVGTSDGFYRIWDSSGERTTTTDALAAARLWDDLAGSDANKAFAAVVALGHVPEVAVPLLGAKLPPAVTVDANNVVRWLRELDSPVFATRRDATRSLRDVAVTVRPAMESLLKTTPSPEVCERLTNLLAAATRPTPADVRAIRAAEILERIATDPTAPAEGRANAIELLRTWASGAAGATLTVEAKETLGRLMPGERGASAP